jgi:hypothetical protein
MKITIDIPDNNNTSELVLTDERGYSRIVNAAKAAYVSMSAIHKAGMWRNESYPEILTIAPRIFYDAVRQCTKGGHTGFTSRPDIKVGDLCHDHYLSPQSGGEFILDTPKYLKDFSLLVKIFDCFRSTIAITSDENTSLINLKHKIPTQFKYKELEIPLYNKKGEEVDNILAPVKFVCEGFWEDYCEWEKEYVLTSHSNYGKPLQEGVLARKQFLKAPNTNLCGFFAG